MSTMTLQLPVNYVEVERDEMEYVDGGWTVCSVETAGNWIDTGIIAVSWAFGIGGAISSIKSLSKLVTSIGRRQAKNMVRQAISQACWFLASSTISSAVDIAFIWMDMSIGKAVAMGIDYYLDANRGNGSIDI